MNGKLGGAKLRAGTPCKRLARRPQGRCRLHGGRSLGGIAHPNFKHGRRSKYHWGWPAGVARAGWCWRRRPRPPSSKR
jgi:hypothetical protein